MRRLLHLRHEPRTDLTRSPPAEDVASTRNALRIAAQAEETGRETLARLGAQGEMIHNTERNLDLSSNQNRLADAHARELKHLNRSMFAVKIDNPFNKASRKRERDELIMKRHHDEKETREATRRAEFDSRARGQANVRELRGPAGEVVPQRKNLAERSKFQFEADSEDEAMEDEIDGNLDALQGVAKNLNLLVSRGRASVDNVSCGADARSGTRHGQRGRSAEPTHREDRSQGGSRRRSARHEQSETRPYKMRGVCYGSCRTSLDFSSPRMAQAVLCWEVRISL